MAKFDIFHTSQVSKDELLPFFEITFDSTSKTKLLSEGETYTTTENLLDLGVDNFINQKLYWDLVNIKNNMGESSTPLSSNSEKRVWGRVTNIKGSNQLRFLPSVSQSDFDFEYFKKYWDDGTLDNSEFIETDLNGNYSVLFCKRLDPACLVIDLTDAPESEYEYAVMGHLDISSNISNHVFRIGYRVSENDDPQSTGHYSSELYSKSRYTTQAGERIHWQGVFPIKLKGGLKYKISICVEHDIEDNSIYSSDECQTGAILSLSNGTIHAIRVDGSSYVSIGSGQDVFETSVSTTEVSHSFSTSGIGNSHSIVRRVSLDDEELSAGKYLVAFAGSISKGGSALSPVQSREVGISVAMAHSLNSTDSYDSFEYIVNNSWVRLRSEKDLVSVGGISIVDYPDISTVTGYKKHLVISLIGNNTSAPVSLQNYSLIAVKILNSDDSNQNPTFGGVSYIKSPYISTWNVAHGMRDEGYYREIELNKNAEDTWTKVPIDYLQAGDDDFEIDTTRPYLNYVSDYILNSTSNGTLAGAPNADLETTSQDEVGVAIWENTSGESGLNLIPADTGTESIVAVNNAINGYTAIENLTDGYLSIGSVETQGATGGSASGDHNFGVNWSMFFVAKLSNKGEIGTTRRFEFIKSNGTTSSASDFSEIAIELEATNAGDSSKAKFITDGSEVSITLDTEAALIIKQADWNLFMFRRENDEYYFYLNGKLMGSVSVASSNVDDNFKRVFNGNTGQLAELCVFKPSTGISLSEREIAFHSKRLIDKFQAVKYVDQDGVKPSAVNIRELTYNKTGKYLEILSHQGVRYSDSSSKKFTVFSFAEILDSDSQLPESSGQSGGVSWIGGRYVSVGSSIAMSETDGFGGDMVDLYFRYNATASEGYMTPSEYENLAIGEVFTLVISSDENLGPWEHASGTFGPRTGEGKSSIEIQLIAKNDRQVESVSISESESESESTVSVDLYHLQFRRTYPPSDTIPYRAARWVGSEGPANEYKTYIQRISSANTAPLVRANFGEATKIKKPHLPVTMTENDDVLSYENIGFGETEPTYEFKYTSRGLRIDTAAGISGSVPAGQDNTQNLRYSGETAQFTSPALNYPSKDHGFVWALMNEDINVENKYWTESIANKVTTDESHILGKSYSYPKSGYIGNRNSPNENKANSEDGHTVSTSAWAGWENSSVDTVLTGSSISGARGKFSQSLNSNKSHPEYGLIEYGTITAKDLDGQSYVEIEYGASSSVLPKIDIPIWDMLSSGDRHIKSSIESRFPPADEYTMETSQSSVQGYMGIKENDRIASTNDAGEITLDKSQRMLRMAVFCSEPPGSGKSFTYCILKNGVALEGNTYPDTTVTISGSNKKAWVEFVDSSPNEAPYFNAGDTYSVRVTASASAGDTVDSVDHGYFIVAQSPVNRLAQMYDPQNPSDTIVSDGGFSDPGNLLDGNSETTSSIDANTSAPRLVFDTDPVDQTSLLPATLVIENLNVNSGSIVLTGADSSDMSVNPTSGINLSLSGSHVFELSGGDSRRYWAIDFPANIALTLSQVSLEAGHISSSSSYDDGIKIYHGGWADAWIYPSSTISPVFSDSGSFKSIIFDGVDDIIERDSSYPAVVATNKSGTQLYSDRSYYGGIWIVAKLDSTSADGKYPFISNGGGYKDQGISYDHASSTFRVNLGAIKRYDSFYSIPSPLDGNSSANTNWIIEDSMNHIYSYTLDDSWDLSDEDLFTIIQRNSTDFTSRNPSFASGVATSKTDHSSQGSSILSDKALALDNANNPLTSDDTWYLDVANEKIVFKLAPGNNLENLKREIYIKGPRWQDNAHWNKVDIQSRLEVTRDEWHVFSFSISYGGKVTVWVDDVFAGSGLMPGGGPSSHVELQSFPSVIDTEDADVNYNVAERSIIIRDSGHEESAAMNFAFFGVNSWSTNPGTRDDSAPTNYYFKGELAEVRVWSDYWNSSVNTGGEKSIHSDEFNLKENEFKTINQSLMEKFMVPGVGDDVTQWINEGIAKGDGIFTQEDFRLYNSDSNTKPSVVAGPNGYKAVKFSPSSNYGSTGHDELTLSTLLTESQSSPDIGFGDNFAFFCVVKFDEKSQEWRHPIVGDQSTANCPTLIEFVSQDADGNGYINYRTMYRTDGQSNDSSEIYHEVRAEVKIQPNSWHLLTLIRDCDGRFDGAHNDIFKVYIDGEEMASVRGTAKWDTPSGARTLDEQGFVNIGRNNNSAFSGCIADIRCLSTGNFKYTNKNGVAVDTNQSGEYRKTRNKVSAEEIRATERILANKYGLIQHRLHKSNYSDSPSIPNATPSSSKRWIHLVADIQNKNLADDSTPFNSSSLIGLDGKAITKANQVVQTWKDISGNSNDFQRVPRYVLDYPTDTSGYNWALLNENILVGVGLWQESHLPLWTASKSSQELGDRVPFIDFVYLPHSGHHSWPARLWGTWGTKLLRDQPVTAQTNPLYFSEPWIQTAFSLSPADAQELAYKGIKDHPSRHNLYEIENSKYFWNSNDHYGQNHTSDASGNYYNQNAFISSDNYADNPPVSTNSSADGGLTIFNALQFDKGEFMYLTREWELNDIRTFVDDSSNSGRYNKFYWGAISVAAKLQNYGSESDQVYPFVCYGTTVNTNSGFFYKHDSSTGKGNFRLRISASMLVGSDQAEYYNPGPVTSSPWSVVPNSAVTSTQGTTTQDYEISLSDLGFAVNANNWQNRIHTVWSNYANFARSYPTSRKSPHENYGSKLPSSGGTTLTPSATNWTSSLASGDSDTSTGETGVQPDFWTVYKSPVDDELYLKIRLLYVATSWPPSDMVILIQGDRWTNKDHYSEIDITSSIEISMDEWHVFTVGWTYDGKVYVVVDGELAGSGTMPGDHFDSYFDPANVGKESPGSSLSFAGERITEFSVKSIGRGAYEHPDGWKKYNGITGYSSDTVDEASIVSDYFHGEIAEIRTWNDHEKFDGWDISTGTTGGYDFEQSLFDIDNGDDASNLFNLYRIDRSVRTKFNIGLSEQPLYVPNSINGYGGVKFSSGGESCFQRTSHPQVGTDTFDNLANSDIFAVIRIDKPWQSAPLFRIADSTLGIGENSDLHSRLAFVFAGSDWEDVSTFNESTIEDNEYVGSNGSSPILYHGSQDDPTKLAQFKWLPRNIPENSVNTSGTMGAGSYILSLHYDSDRYPKVKLNGKTIIDYTGADYAASSSISSISDWFLGGVGLVGDNDAYNDNPSSHEDIGYFDGYISEFIAYSGLDEVGVEDVFEYLSDKYNIETNTKRRTRLLTSTTSASSNVTTLDTSYLDEGEAVSREYGMLSSFYIGYGERYEGDPARIGFEIATNKSGLSRSYGKARVYDPSFVWIEENPGIEVSSETNVDLIVELEVGSLYKNTWEGPSGGSDHVDGSNTILWSAGSYTISLPGVNSVSRVVRNGEEVHRIRNLSFNNGAPDWGNNKSNLWYWDYDRRILHLLMAVNLTSPNDSSQNVMIYESRYYGREPVDITWPLNIVQDSSVDDDPTGSDVSLVFKSKVADKSKSGDFQIPYEPRLIDVPGYSQELQTNGEDISVATSFGDLALINSDGEFDSVSGSEVYEGGRAKIYRSFSDNSNSHRDLELVFNSVQGSPAASREAFSLTLFDDQVKLSDPLSQVRFESNNDTGSQTAYSEVDWSLYFGSHYRVPAYRVSNFLHKYPSTSEGHFDKLDNMQIFKVCDHPIKISDKGIVSTVTREIDPTTTNPWWERYNDDYGTQFTTNVDQSTETGLAIYLAEDSEYAFRGDQALIVTDQALTRCGMFGIIRDKAAFEEVNGLTTNSNPTDGQKDEEDFFLSQTLYVDIIGLPEDSTVVSNDLNSGGVYGPGEIHRFLLETYPKVVDEEDGYYATTTATTATTPPTNNYRPTVNLSSFTNFIPAYLSTITLANSTDMSQIPVLSKVKLRYTNPADSSEICLHATVLYKSGFDIAIQPQFVIGDVRLDKKEDGGDIDDPTNPSSSAGQWNDIFKNEADEIFPEGSELIVYEKSIGIDFDMDSRFNLNSFAEVDSKFRKKQMTNAAAIEVVRYGKNDGSIAIPGSSPLSDALYSVSRQFFTYWYFDKNGRASLGVPDFDWGNLLENPGVEENDANRGNINSADHTVSRINFPWESFGFQNANADINNVFEGKGSLPVKSGVSKGYAAQSVYLSPGKYGLSLLAKASNTTASSAGIGVQLPGSLGHEIQSEPKALVSGSWTRISLVFDVPNGQSGEAVVKIYPDIENYRTSGSEVNIVADNIELYKISGVVDDSNSSISEVYQDPNGFYAAKVFYEVDPRTGGVDSYQQINDNEAFGLGLSVSQAKSAFETSGILEFQESNSTDKDSATEIAARALGYYSRPRQQIAIEMMGITSIPKVGDWVFIDRANTSRKFFADKDSPFAKIKSVDYSASDGSNSITVTAERQIDFVIDRSESAPAEFPLGAIVLCSGDACPPGFDDITSDYANLFLAAPEPGNSPELGVVKGQYTHFHSARHNHSISDHEHNVYLSLRSEANTPNNLVNGVSTSMTSVKPNFARTANKPILDDTNPWLTGDNAFNYNRNTWSDYSWVPMSVHSHHNPADSNLVTKTTSTVTGSSETASVTTKTGSNFFSHVNVRLCKRSGQLYEESSEGHFESYSESGEWTTSTYLPSTIIVGYTEPTSSLPDGFEKADSLYLRQPQHYGSDPGLIRCTGILSLAINADDNLTVSNPNGGELFLSSYTYSENNLTRNTTQRVKIQVANPDNSTPVGNFLEVGKRIYFQDPGNSKSRIHAVIHEVEPPLSDTDYERVIQVEPLNEVFSHDGQFYSDKSVKAYPEDPSPAEDINGWLLMSDSSEAGTYLDNGQYGILHAHDASAILLPHSHTLVHHHEIEISSDPNISDTDKIYTGLVKTSYSLSEILHHGFVPTWAMQGDGPYSLYNSSVRNKERTVPNGPRQVDLYELNESPSFSGYEGYPSSGSRGPADYNESDWSYPPMNHRHTLTGKTIPTTSASITTDNSSGNAEQSLFAKQNDDNNSNKISPPIARLHWIKPIYDNDQDNRAENVPSGAVLFFEGSKCPSGYVRLDSMDGYMLGIQISDSLGISYEELDHFHEYIADPHVGGAHVHDVAAGVQSNGAIVRQSDLVNGGYQYFSRENTTVNLDDLPNPGSFKDEPTPSSTTEQVVGGLFPNDDPNDIFSNTINMSYWRPGPHKDDADSPPANFDGEQHEDGAHTHEISGTIISSSGSIDAASGQETGGSRGGIKPKYKELLACKRN